MPCALTVQPPPPVRALFGFLRSISGRNVDNVWTRPAVQYRWHPYRAVEPTRARPPVVVLTPGPDRPGSPALHFQHRSVRILVDMGGLRAPLLVQRFSELEARELLRFKHGDAYIRRWITCRPLISVCLAAVLRQDCTNERPRF